MTLPKSGPISLTQVQSEFGGTAPTSLSEYYRSGQYVVSQQAAGTTGDVPSSGTISLSDFLGMSAYRPDTGEAIYGDVGTWQWVCPPGVTSVCAVCIGGGKSGGSTVGGGGGGLGWKNNIPVTPGQSYTVVVGAASGNSYFISLATVAGLGATSTVGGGFVGDGGGNGGTADSSSGGGAGGYTGAGGNAGVAGAGGGGAGGFSSYDGYTLGGGGVWYYGEGPSGGITAYWYAGGGSWGDNSSNYVGGDGGLYGGGGRKYFSATYQAGAGAQGAVRLIWGPGMSFPNNATIYNDASFTTPGTYTWTAPAGVWNVTVACIGGGGGAIPGFGGGGAGLGWASLEVTPGQTYTVVVGAAGTCTDYTTNAASSGGVSYFKDPSTVAGLGGTPGSQAGAGTGGGFVGDGGGTGGSPSATASANYWRSGGGAAGYTGAGGNPGVAGVAGGAGGGAGNTVYTSYNGAGGGTGIGGRGANGSAGVAGTTHPGGYGGSGGTEAIKNAAGLYGGGAGGAYTGALPTPTPTSAMSAGSGAVRIVWGGRMAYPSNATLPT